MRQTKNCEDNGLTNSKVHKSGNTSRKSPIADDGKSPKLELPEDAAELQQRLKLKQNLKVELCSRDLWRKFHSLGTEMIITKAGR